MKYDNTLVMWGQGGNPGDNMTAVRMLVVIRDLADLVQRRMIAHTAAAKQIPTTVDGRANQPCLLVLATLKVRLALQKLDENIVHKCERATRYIISAYLS